MRRTSTHRARALVGAAAAAALAVTGLVALSAPARAAGPDLDVSKDANLAYAGEQITVTGTSYPAGVTLYVTECDIAQPPGSACDMAGFAQVTVKNDGTFSTPLTVHGQFASTDCKATGVDCAVVTSDSNNPGNMAAYDTEDISFADPVPTLALSKSVVTVGDVVKLTGTYFPATATTLGVTICGYPPSATNCDMDLHHIGQITYDGSGGFTFNYTIKATSFTSGDGAIDCSKVQCVIGTTNLMAPGDPSYNAVAKFSVGKAPGKAKISKLKVKKHANVLVKWKAAKAHGAPVTGYKVQVRKAHKKWQTAGTTGPAKTRLVWKNGKHNTTYKFRVVAKSAAGNTKGKAAKITT